MLLSLCALQFTVYQVKNSTFFSRAHHFVNFRVNIDDCGLHIGETYFLISAQLDLKAFKKSSLKLLAIIYLRENLKITLIKSNLKVWAWPFIRLKGTFLQK